MFHRVCNAMESGLDAYDRNYIFPILEISMYVIHKVKVAISSVIYPTECPDGMRFDKSP